MRLTLKGPQANAVVNSSLMLKKLGMFAFFISLSNNVSATTNFSPESCNTGFFGVVKSVANSSAPSSSLPKERITFEVKETLKGEPGLEYSLDIIKGGPHTFKIGEKFRVYAEDYLVCDFQEV